MVLLMPTLMPTFSLSIFSLPIWKEGFDGFRLNNIKSSRNKHFNYEHLIRQRFDNQPDV
jgi:hypothetical protein